MLVGAIREKKSVALKVEAPSVTEARQLLSEQLPEGYELAVATPEMTKGATSVIVEAVAEARGEVQYIEAPTYAELREKVPEGWVLLQVVRKG